MKQPALHRTGRSRSRQACVVMLLALVLIAAVNPPGGALEGDAEAKTSQRKRAPDAKIAGGYFPHPTQWPWVAYVRGGCTGTLIAPDRVLTAGHCVVSGDTPASLQPAYKFDVVVGTKNFNDPNQGERRKVTAIALHPGYNTHVQNDVAVLFLDHPVTTIAPAVFGASETWSSWGTAMGFGHSNYDHETPVTDGHLRAADFVLYNDTQCHNSLNAGRMPQYYSATHFCGDDAAGGNLDCITHGDSGGPFMVLGADNIWRLIGVTSFLGDNAAHPCDGPFVWAWASGPTLRSWILTVPRPPSYQPVLERGNLPRYIRTMLSDHKVRSVGRIRRSCSAVSVSEHRCRLKWRSPRHNYRGTARFWLYAQDFKLYWTYDFDGKRRTPGCRRCTKSLHW